MFDSRTPKERARDLRIAEITNKQRIAWAKQTLAKFPNRKDLQQLIDSLA